MKLVDQLRIKVAKWPYRLLSLMAAISSFGAYTCMYAFRKAFTAGTFTGLQYFHVDYKVWLIIAQILGYTASKFYGIKFIAELKPSQRARYILLLIGIAWIALLFFAFVPPPYNIIFLFINGFPLGLIWGLVFGYLEGRKSTEFMAAVLSISLVFASGFVKTIARSLLSALQISEYDMPFVTGALFVLPLLLFVFFLELMPAPTDEDLRLRTKRLPMDATERKNFLKRFLPGITLTLIVYVLLTVMREVRDSFEVEIWNSLGIRDNSVYAKIDTIISVIVLIAMSLLVLVRKNLQAFRLIHIMIISGCALIGLGTVLFALNLISPMVWMTLAGIGLYMGYVPYNAVFFERLLASFRYTANVGFLMYLADSMGYLGSVGVLLVKELGHPNISWGMFFKHSVMGVAVIGGIGASCSLLYFLRSARKKDIELKKQILNIQTA